MTATVSGLTPGLHGFHVHTDPRTDTGCLSTGGHYNPFDNEHGGPDNPERHVGDLGNIEADENGDGTLDITDNVIQLSG